MQQWDPESLSKRFLYAAESAENFVRHVGPKAGNQTTYQAVHDQHLAEYYVYNRLHGRTWLDDRASLLGELQRMRGDVPEHVPAFDHGTFSKQYTAVTDSLIAEFSDGEA